MPRSVFRSSQTRRRWRRTAAFTTDSDTPATTVLVASDPTDDELTFSVVSPPLHGDLTDDGCPESGVCSYVPDSGFVGTDNFTFRATDDLGAQSNVATVTISVEQPPTKIVSAGPLTRIEVTGDLNCAVDHVDDSQPEFFGDTACATLVAVEGILYGPEQIPAGGAASPRTAFTPISQSGVTGSGTEASPSQIVSVVDLGTSGVRLMQTDTYVVGQEAYRTTVVLSNGSGSSADIVVYRAGDCYLQNSNTVSAPSM